MSAQEFINMLSADIGLAYDVETNGLKWQGGFVCGYSISDGQNAYYVPVRHEPGGNIENVEEFEHDVARIIKNRTAPLYTHNGKFDSHFSLNHGIELGNKIEDTMIGAALLDEYARSYSLKAQAAKYQDIPQKKDVELIAHLQVMFACSHSEAMGYFWKLSGFDNIARQYAAFDTLTTYHLRKKQEKEIYAQGLDMLFRIECKLLHVLRKMERRGVRIDMAELDRVRDKIDELQMEAYTRIPMKEDMTPINIRSNKDLIEYFEMLDINDFEFTEPSSRFPQGQPSFNKGFLGQHEEGKVLLAARALDHFKNSFIDPIDQYIFDGRIHTNFNQTLSEFGGTKSGRLSCNNPNMQQVPKRHEELGRIFRKIFIPTDGYKYVELDYSQAEPRLFAHYSEEEILINGYHSEPAIDMHSLAGQYMGITRKIAKNLNLGLLYAMGIAKLAKSLGLSENETRDIYYRWKRTFPKGSELTKFAAQVAEQRGYVKTILGRRARFPDARWSYRALNRIIQGGSADILKYKMVQIDDYLVDNNLEDQVRVLLNIHDAILVEIKDDDKFDERLITIKDILEDVQSQPFNLKVPFKADYLTGYDWCEASYGAH